MTVVAAAAASSSSSVTRRCQSVGSFKFTDEVPRRADLTFCHQFKRSTCCNATHTSLLARRAVWFYEADASFSDQCRRFASSLLCYACDPSVGTHERIGICASACNAWYDACKNDHFTMVESDGSIRPCSDDDTVCWPLSSLITSGAGMCRLYDLPIARQLPALLSPLLDGAQSSQSLSSATLVGNGEDWGQQQCYEHNPSLAASAAPDSPFTKKQWQRSSGSGNDTRLSTWQMVALGVMVTIIVSVIGYVIKVVACSKDKKPSADQVRAIRASRLAAARSTSAAMAAASSSVSHEETS